MGTPVAMNRHSDLGAHTREYVASPSLGRNNTFLSTKFTLCNNIVTLRFNTLRVCSIWDVACTSKTGLGNPLASLVYCNPPPSKRTLHKLPVLYTHVALSHNQLCGRTPFLAEGTVAKGFPVRSILGWGVTGQHVFDVTGGYQGHASPNTKTPGVQSRCGEIHYGAKLFPSVPLLVRLGQGSPGTLLITQRPPRGWCSSVLHVVQRGATSYFLFILVEPRRTPPVPVPFLPRVCELLLLLLIADYDE